MCSGTPSGATHTGTSTQEGTPSLGPGDTSVPVATAAEQRAKKGERGARPRESQAKGKAKRARGDGVEKAAKPAQAKAIDEDMSKKEKRAKTSTKPKIPRKPAVKRAKKENPSKDDGATLPSLPSPSKIAETEKGIKKTVPSRTGRRRTGAYSREEVNAIQTWITNRVAEDWATIALETGSYRHKDNLKTFYETVVLRQVREAFADKNGDGGSITAVDVSQDIENVCGACGAKQIKVTKKCESTVGEALQEGEGAKQEKALQETEEAKQEKALQETEEAKQEKVLQETEEAKLEETAEITKQCQENISPSIGEEQCDNEH